MFDPDLQTRHSAADNLDFIAPTAPAVGDDLGHVDPYPYDNHTGGYDKAYEQGGYDHGYDNYAGAGAGAAHHSMSMPDARDYQPYAAYGDNYGSYAGVGAAGAVAAYQGHDYSDDPYAAHPNPAVSAKAQEANLERERALSPDALSQSGASATYNDAHSSQGHLNDGTYHDVHADNLNEIPPK